MTHTDHLDVILAPGVRHVPKSQKLKFVIHKLEPKSPFEHRSGNSAALIAGPKIWLSTAETAQNLTVRQLGVSSDEPTSGQRSEHQLDRENKRLSCSTLQELEAKTWSHLARDALHLRTHAHHRVDALRASIG